MNVIQQNEKKNVMWKNNIEQSNIMMSDAE